MKGLYHPGHVDRPLWRGRRMFLEKLAEVNPAVLDGLRHMVYDQLVRAEQKEGWLAITSHLAAQGYDGPISPNPGVSEALKSWQTEFCLTDSWVLWYACWTLREWFGNGLPASLRWKTDLDGAVGEVIYLDTGIRVSYQSHKSLREPFDLNGDGEPMGLQAAIFEMESFVKRHLPLTFEQMGPQLGLAELRAKGWKPLPPARTRSKPGSPAEWLAYHQTLAWPWHCIASLHQVDRSVQSVVNKTIAYAKSIGLTMRKLETGPRGHAAGCRCPEVGERS